MGQQAAEYGKEVKTLSEMVEHELRGGAMNLEVERCIAWQAEDLEQNQRGHSWM